MKENRDLMKGLLGEAQAYVSLEEIEKLLDESRDFGALPVQPLYVLLKNQSSDLIAQCLSRFSKEQREAFLDLDLWEKDSLDVESFLPWLNIYNQCSDETVLEDFVCSDHFILFLKGKFHLATFDQEDPQYPDHDHFFITDDQLLLVEYDEDFNQVNELKRLIRKLYEYKGVENAYAHLFKAISENFSVLEEEEYYLKKERQREFGFVDYFESLEIDTPFPNFPVMENFVKKKTKNKTQIDDYSKSQTLHRSGLLPFQTGLENLNIELQKIESNERFDYLQFNFVRLVNSGLSRESAFKEGTVAINKVGQAIKAYIVLGFDFVKTKKGPLLGSSESLFDFFDFIELYKIGKTLISDHQKKLKKVLSGTVFVQDYEYFIGSYWEEFLDNSFEAPVKYRWPGNLQAKEIFDYESAELWGRRVRTFVDTIPFALKFFQVFHDLRQNGRIMSSFYLNYSIDEIDFESIILSSFANYMQGHLEVQGSPKLGLTIDDFRLWIAKVIDANGRLKNSPELEKIMNQFSKDFGLDKIYDFTSYLTEIMRTQLEGYEYEKLSYEDFKHVGGPLILAILRN